VRIFCTKGAILVEITEEQFPLEREIAKMERMSIRDISIILKEEESKQQNYKQHEISTQAYKLFSEGKRPVEVAVALSLREPEATKLYREYWKLKRLYILNSIYKETNGKLGPFLKIYKQLVMKRRMTIEQVVNTVDIAANKLPYMESLYGQVKDQVDKMQRTRQGLSNDIEAYRYKISVLDKNAFSSEQYCKRIEQQVQELTAQKNSLEKWIANILNNDKVKQTIKENVKAALSENKQLIPVAFTALLQTLTSDPQMIQIIYKILTANDREQHEDNAIKYLESNKDSILDLAEKNYENLIEVLTNNIMNTAAASSLSNSSLSPKFNFGTWNQSDTYTIEDPESFRNSKGDIAD
jgi:hypothetical protein